MKPKCTGWVKIKCLNSWRKHNFQEWISQLNKSNGSRFSCWDISFCLTLYTNWVPVHQQDCWLCNLMQVIQSQPVSHACDVWSYGVVRALHIIYVFIVSNNLGYFLVIAVFDIKATLASCLLTLSAIFVPHQARLAGGDIVFSGCPLIPYVKTGWWRHCVLRMSIDPSICLFLCLFVHLLQNLWTRYFANEWTSFGASSRGWKGMKQSTLGVMRSKVKVTHGQTRSQKFLLVRFLENYLMNFNQTGRHILR